MLGITTLLLPAAIFGGAVLLGFGHRSKSDASASASAGRKRGDKRGRHRKRGHAPSLEHIDQVLTTLLPKTSDTEDTKPGSKRARRKKHREPPPPPRERKRRRAKQTPRVPRESGEYPLTTPSKEAILLPEERVTARPSLSDIEAAEELYRYVTEVNTNARTWGDKSGGNPTIAEYQAAMGGLEPDGIYGPATRRRGKILTGKTFPPRR